MSRDRGQLLVGGVLVLGMLLVSTAMVLNGVLFTYHQSQASATVATHDPATVGSEAQSAVGSVVRRVNAANATDYDSLSATITDEVDGWERWYARHYLTDGVSVSVTVRQVTRGARLADGNATRSLTAADGSDDWTLATDVTDSREGRFTLAADSLAATGDPAPFRLVADNGSATWTVTVTNDTSGGSEVTVAAPAGTATCTTTEGTVDVDVTDGTVDGTDCSHLALPAALDAPYALRIENGSSASGTFTATVANATALPTANYDRGDDPTFTPVAYRVTVGVDYREPSFEYRSREELTPGADREA